jgi:vesicle transport through interaction with t-SNAREs 1
VKHVDALLMQAGDLVKQMEVEIRSHDAATRKVLSEKISQYKKSLASLRSDFERARTESQRSNLNLDGKSAADRDRFLATNDKYVPHYRSACSYPP